jgi:hypothetical protein
MPSFLMESESTLVAGLKPPLPEAHARVKEVMDKMLGHGAEPMPSSFHGRVYPLAMQRLEAYMPHNHGLLRAVGVHMQEQAKAHVRKAVVRAKPQPHTQTSLDHLASLADAARIGTTSEGAYIEWAFRDDVFENVLCRVFIQKEGTLAEFVVHNDHHRRLFEAEAGRLRVSLEERGLRNVQVKVVQEPSK